MSAAAAPFVRTLVGALAVMLAGAIGVAGAASRPAGLWLGLPAPVVAAALALAVAALAARRTGRAALGLCAGLAAPVALVCFGLPLAGVRALAGPPLLALALAAVALTCAISGWRPGRRAFLPLAFLILATAASWSHLRVGARGDEPHYMMVADSLLRDGDLALTRDYLPARYEGISEGPLAPHYRVRGKDGEIYSLHAVGLSLLILPAWALAGYAGVTLFMALMSALLAREVRQWVAELTGREDLADAAGWLLVLSPPLLHYSGLVFSEVPAALALAFGLRVGRREPLGWRGAVVVGLSAAALPWLNVRYAPLALLVLAHGVSRRRRGGEWAGLALPALVSAIGIAAYHQAIYGFWDPRRVYGRRPELSLASLGEGVPGLFFDQEFGLFVYAPIFALAVPGLALLWRRDRRLGLTASLAVLAVVLTAGSWHMWRGGFNPPGRFLVPLVPLLALAVAHVWERRGLTAGAALLLGWGLWTGLTGAVSPELVHRDRDETAPFFRRQSGAREWTALLPGYVLSERGRGQLALLWAITLAAAIPWRRAVPSSRRLAIAGLGLVAAAEVASRLSDSSTEDRDAVRLVGRPALAVPGWRVVRAATGDWPIAALGWGPVYEPHRHPAGATLGRRLPLRSGSYRLEVDRAPSSPRSSPPRLRVGSDAPGAPWRDVALTERPDGLQASFEVRPGERGIDLRLWDGGPLLLGAVRLRGQPSRP